LLFGLGRRAAFPVDVWMKRIMEELYFDGKDTKKADIEAFAAEKFGELGGYAQQYLFDFARRG
jgi:N-glycosylase/DNA lyase